MKRNLVLVYVIAALCLTGCQKAVEDDNGEDNNEPAVKDLAYEIVADGLHIPWSISFDGTAFYISEREGAIVKIEEQKFERQEVQLKDTLSNTPEAGFLGFVLHPEKENTAIAYYTYESGSGPLNRVVELTMEGSTWKEEKTLIDHIPSGTVHHGGRIKIGPDEKLYITTGDASNPDAAQDINHLSGKILRLDLNGSVPEDNPIKGSYIYSFGHRNPQGLAWDDEGNLYSSEHGQSAHDEINKIEPGANYGWPLIQGDEQMESMKSPLFHSGESTWAPSGIDYKEGRLYVSMLRGQGVLSFNLAEGTYEQIVSDFGRVRDVFVFNDDLYFITNNTDGRGNPKPDDDKLVKISLKK